MLSVYVYHLFPVGQERITRTQGKSWPRWSKGTKRKEKTCCRIDGYKLFVYVFFRGTLVLKVYVAEGGGRQVKSVKYLALYSRKL